MFEALKHHLATLATRVLANEALLKVAQKRHHNWRRRSENRWARFAEAKAEAEAEGADLDTFALRRLKRRAVKAQERSQFWVGRIKTITARIDHLEATEHQVRLELHRWVKEHGIQFIGENKVRGDGVPAWKLQKAAMLKCEHNYLVGDQPGYYSQSGAERDYAHGLYHYGWGNVWDCSTWNDAINYVCGLESPSGHEYRLGGYTATELAYSTPVARGDLLPGDFIIYLRWPGDTVGKHVERILDVGREITLGHGDSAINRNSRFDMFGDGNLTFRRMHKTCPRLH